MRLALLSYLACPECGSDLDCAAGEHAGDEVVTGTLECAACARVFPIANGVPA